MNYLKLIPLVGFVVFIQLISGNKALSAYSALVGQFADVRRLVPLQVRYFNKRLVAQITPEPSIAAVYLLVIREVPRGFERLGTHVALERTPIAVRRLVLTQASRGAERLVALGARVRRLISDVRLPVLGQFPSGRVHLRALGAFQ